MEYKTYIKQLMTESMSFLNNVHRTLDKNPFPHQRGVTTTRTKDMEKGMPEAAKKKSGILLMPTMNSDAPNFSKGNMSMDFYANF
jgi:hypothetical protein